VGFARGALSTLAWEEAKQPHFSWPLPPTERKRSFRVLTEPSVTRRDTVDSCHPSIHAPCRRTPPGGEQTSACFCLESGSSSCIQNGSNLSNKPVKLQVESPSLRPLSSLCGLAA
jgi:hypothetical protein